MIDRDGGFAVSIEVRVYELDLQGHLNSAVYHSYAEHARWRYLAAAGITVDMLRADGVGPVFLESTIRYRRELRAGDTVEVSCAFDFPAEPARTFVVAQRFRLPDGTVAAEVSSVTGLLDLRTRRLVEDPRGRLSALAARAAPEPDPPDSDPFRKDT
jgi:acyl-CoA thioester hydrolase